MPSLELHVSHPAADAVCALPVLVVDDESAIREVVAAFLGFSGFHVHAVDNVPDAIAWLQANTATLVVTDMIMPGPSGLELIDWIQRERAGLCVVVLSGSIAMSKLEAMIDAGGSPVRRVLGKPFRGAELVDVVKQLTAAAAR